MPEYRINWQNTRGYTAGLEFIVWELSTKKCDIEHARLHRRRLDRLAKKAASELKRSTKKPRTVFNFQSRLVRALFRNEDLERVELILGYSMDELRVHLERQFTKGMSWDNHISKIHNASPREGWHIDHIIPKSKLETIAEANALSNLRPLWGIDNVAKGAKRTHLI